MSLRFSSSRGARWSAGSLLFGCVSASIACGSGIDSPPDPAKTSPGLPFAPSTSDEASPASGAAPATPARANPSGEAQPTPALAAPSTPAPESPWQPPTAIDPSTPVGSHGQLRVQGTALVDESGAPVQLKGVSTMWLNWESRYSTSKAGLQWMRDNWHLSVIRAAMGVEPDGAYLKDPERMLTELRQVVHNAIDLGVYVLIDWHDHHAYDHQAQSVDFFTKIAGEFGSFPNVLYETFNEPEQDPDWSTKIKPYHQAALAAIRAKDSDGVVILGSRQWSQRPDEAIKDPVQGDNLMYTVHFYACDHREPQRNEAQAAYDAGLALFVTEWGATPADGGAKSPTVCEDEATLWHDWMDERNIGWAAWKLDACADSSCLFNSKDAPVAGGWTDQWLNGHARFVVKKLAE
jgi:endoglucanase